MQTSPERDVLEIVGIAPAEMVISTNLAIGAVVLELPGADLQLLISPTSATDLILKLISSISKINDYGCEGEFDA
jgi:hypothetical protein